MSGMPRWTGPRRTRRAAGILALLVALVATTTAGPAPASAAQPASGATRSASWYQNPILPAVPGDGAVESCADPTVLHGQQPGDQFWYMYCTTDPLNDKDLDAAGALRFHRIPTMRSVDLVNWEYVGDAFNSLPNWAAPTAALWAPDVVYSPAFGQYYLLFVVTDTADAVSGEPGCGSDNAIGIATGATPTGPWTFSDQPVVGPRRGGPGCNFLWTFDPEITGDTITGTVDNSAGDFYYGSYYGGIFGDHLTLTATGATVTGTPTQVATDNKYEGANVVHRDGYYYLFVSAANCCNGTLTGYSVFTGRSTTPFGPFLDREGNSLLDPQAGGTPVISMNGNKWVGTGHNSVFQDFAGQWWTMYHAVDRANPFFATAPGFTKRPAMLDALDWVNGWPTVRGGQWASNAKQPAPAAQPGQRTRYRSVPPQPQLPGRTLSNFSDQFSTGLDPAWTWIRPPAPDSYAVQNGALRLPIQRAELYQDDNTASVLVRDAPRGDYIVETKVRVDVPDAGCCFNYAQAGLVIYGGDDNFVKLTNSSIWNTRQTEWAKELSPVPAGWARYGNSVVGPPSEDWTYLRIVVEQLHGRAKADALGDTERYTAYTSQDGATWVRGGAWTHTLGKNARIGVVAMGQQPTTGGTFTADFDYVRVTTVRGGSRP